MIQSLSTPFRFFFKEEKVFKTFIEIKRQSLQSAERFQRCDVMLYFAQFKTKHNKHSIEISRI